MNAGEDFDHEPCYAQLKALKAKFRARQIESSRRLMAQMEAMQHGLTMAFQSAWNAGYQQALRDLRELDGPVE